MKAESARLMSEHMGFTSAAVHPDNVVTTMSGGEKQGVAITRALYFDAELVILDEPTMGLSPHRNQEDPRFRRQHQEGRQIGDLHRSQHLPRLSGGRPALRARSRPVAGVYDKAEISMDELIDRLYRVARTGSLE